MFDIKYPFGHTVAIEFIKGDLVSWSDFSVESDILIRDVKFGTFLETKTKFIGNREVSYASVFELSTGLVIDVLAIRLRKDKTT